MHFNKCRADLGMSFPFGELLVRGPLVNYYLEVLLSKSLIKIFCSCQVADARASEQKHLSVLSQKFYMGSAYFKAMKKKEYIFTHLL